MNRKQRSGVFMMEMIAVVCFFILCAGICIQTFVQADLISRKASDLNQGVLIAQSVAEVWKAEGPEGLQKQFLAEPAEDRADGYLMGFDRNGAPCKASDAVFGVRAELSDPGKAEITVSREGNTVYSLNAGRHEPCY